jgi:hypothetical protein
MHDLQDDEELNKWMEEEEERESDFTSVSELGSASSLEQETVNVEERTIAAVARPPPPPENISEVSTENGIVGLFTCLRMNCKIVISIVMI